MSETKTNGDKPKSDRVALWAKDMMRGVITRAEAEELVKTGKYHWIHDSAINWIETPK
jgi:hypothetical protein